MIPAIDGVVSGLGILAIWIGLMVMLLMALSLITGQAGLLRLFVQGLATCMVALGTLCAALMSLVVALVRVTPPRIQAMLGVAVLLLVLVHQLGRLGLIVLSGLTTVAAVALVVYLASALRRRR